jgi:hypothetical protein
VLCRFPSTELLDRLFAINSLFLAKALLAAFRSFSAPGDFLLVPVRDPVCFFLLPKGFRSSSLICPPIWDSLPL